jgi:hypothetical protein
VTPKARMVPKARRLVSGFEDLPLNKTCQLVLHLQNLRLVRGSERCSAKRYSLIGTLSRHPAKRDEKSNTVEKGKPKGKGGSKGKAKASK